MKRNDISKNSNEEEDRVDIDVDQLSADTEIPLATEDNQLQGGDDLNNTSEGSDDGNARNL